MKGQKQRWWYQHTYIDGVMEQEGMETGGEGDRGEVDIHDIKHMVRLSVCVGMPNIFHKYCIMKKII